MKQNIQQIWTDKNHWSQYLGTQVCKFQALTIASYSQKTNSNTLTKFVLKMGKVSSITRSSETFCDLQYLAYNTQHNK